MSAREVEKVVCPQCSTVLDVGEDFCRHCGARTAPSGPGTPRESAAGAATAEPAPGRAKAWHKIAENRGLVLLLLFAALGPLALPLLWWSSRFSRPWKIVLTFLVFVLTVLLVWLIWYLINVLILEPLKEYEIIGTC